MGKRKEEEAELREDEYERERPHIHAREKMNVAASLQ